MLRPVLERFTYEKTTTRLLEMIAADHARVAMQSKIDADTVPLAA
jgi:hypothetical protein